MMPQQNYQVFNQVQQNPAPTFVPQQQQQIQQQQQQQQPQTLLQPQPQPQVLPQTALTVPSITTMTPASGVVHVSPSINLAKRFTKICTNWQKGHCAYGDGCTFAHGENKKVTTRSKRKDKKRKERNERVREEKLQEDQAAATTTPTATTTTTTTAAPGSASPTADAVPAAPAATSPYNTTAAATKAYVANLNVDYAPQLSTPVNSPLVPESPGGMFLLAGFQPSELDTPVPLTDTPVCQNHALGGLLQSQLEQDPQFLQQGESFRLEDPAPACDVLSLNGGGMGAASVTSSMFRMDPYGGAVVDRFYYEDALKVPQMSCPTEDVSVGGDEKVQGGVCEEAMDLSPTRSKGRCSPVPEDTHIPVKTTLTPRSMKRGWISQHSPSDNVITSEGSSVSGSENIQEA